MSATPPQGIDRGAFLALLDELSDGDDDRMFDQDDLYQGLLALVRPVEGVTLTPEEAKAAHEFVWTALLPDRLLTPPERAMGEYVLARLAAHLEATQ